MTLTEYTIRNKIVSWTVTLLLVVGGLIAFLGLGRLEDPEFTIKKAVVVTAYPGASAREVEEELTLPIENAIQQLPYVDHITSISSAGLSQVTVEMKSFYRKHDLAQIWDEMRRKIRDMEAGLPPGAAKPTINDDFADVYGMYFAVTGEGYDDGELADYADFLRRELVLVEGVGKVAIGGRRQQQVVLEINRAKLSALNLPPSSLRQLLQAQNLVSDAGRIRVGNEYMRIQSTTAHQSVADLANLMLGRAGGRIIYLSDVANLSKSYQDPPSHLYRFNGRPGLTLGVSFTSGVNVVEIGKALRTRLSELESERPIGMSVSTIYDQPAQVEKSVNAFLVGLAQAVAIVIVVLLVAMGLRS
ncbi:MAG: MFS transporter, partial [Hyphomicrobiales bacterium]